MAITGRTVAAIGLALALASPLVETTWAQGNAVAPATMKRIGTVDERYQSFNVEMVEVTGGRFWAPYKSGKADAATPAPKPGTPVGMDPSLYEYRAPIDLGNARLRKLAAALGPSYVRVSGTWANSTYFQDSDGPAAADAPAGFNSVLTRAEWKGVVDFSKAVDAKIVTSFAISQGVRDADGVWTPVEAKKIFAYTKAVGGSIAAAEMFNEPTFAGMGGAPKGYTAENYGRDFKVFAPYVRKAAPEMKILGPGSVGEETSMAGAPGLPLLRTQDLLAASGPGLDIFSYHFYGGVSKRCAQLGAASQTGPEEALSSEWLGRSEKNEAFYGGLRDKYLPGHAIWLTETGETACGGNPWASTFVDSFRYLNQLGALAKVGVQVIIHNTLAASDYALINGATLEPRPNYWAALLWRRLMGTGVLEAGVAPQPGLHVYAQCLRGSPGGVALLVINADKAEARRLDVPVKGERYTLTAKELTGTTVELNGKELGLGADGNLPKLEGTATAAGAVRFDPESITFLGLAGAENAGCRE